MRPINQAVREDSFHFQSYYSSKNISFGSQLSKQKRNSTSKKVSLYAVILSLLYINKIRKNIKRRKYRQKLVEEWYQTQLSYCWDLRATINFIKKPMEEIKIINCQQSSILFPQIEAMLQISEKMINALSNARNVASPYKIRLGKQLYEFVSDYRVYGTYFSTHSKRLNLVSEILSSSENQVNKFKGIELAMQAEFSKHNRKKEGMTIKDCMDQPLYRIFKYIILLKQYSNKMGKFHPDYKSIKKCQALFHDINNNNNNMMKKMEEKQKLKKLASLFGENVKGQDRQFIVQMEARTVYNKVKLYIFTDCLVVTKVEQLFGSEKQERFAVYEITQFGYISGPPNLKYFKNIVTLISKQHCIHFFFTEEDSKLQFITCIQKIITQIRVWNYQNRRVPKKYLILQKRVSDNSLSSSQKQIRFAPMEPELRIEVTGFQVRASGTLSSNSIYIIRFMIPIYYEDEVTCKQDEEKYIQKQYMKNFQFSEKHQKNYRGYDVLETTQTSGNSDNSQKSSKKNRTYCIYQKIQMNYSLLEELYDHMQTLCSSRIPELDPLTKDVNFYSKGTKKTKFFEVRKFLIEEFFNFALRSTSILSHPSWFLSKMRINQDLWNYAAKRNSAMKESKSGSIKSYGFDHCETCQSARIRSIEQFEYLRDQYNSGKNYRQNKEEKEYCFNFYNLIKSRFQYLNMSNFNTCQRILAYFHYLEGRLDYPFLFHRNKDKNIKLLKIYLPSIEQRCVQVQIDEKTTVGEIIDQLGNILHMKNCFDFDLMTYYGQTSNRLLDRDQYLLDVVKALDISTQQISVTNSVVKKKFNFNIFSTLSNLIQSNPHQNKIYFLKTFYFNKSLEIKSFIAYPEKLFLEIQKIYWTIKRARTKLSKAQFVERAAHWCCLKQFSNIQSSQILKSSSKLVDKIMPDQYLHIFHYDQEFKIDILEAIQRERAFLVQNQKSIQHLQFKILEAAYQKIEHRTYYVVAQSKQIPTYFSRNLEIPEQVLLGVNYKSLVVARNEPNPTVLFTLPIGEIQYYLSVFSIFITYQTWSLRFDGKMLHHFGQMVRKYQTILAKFPQYMA